MTRRRIDMPPEAAAAAEALGQQIRVARSERGLTSSAVAELAGVSQRTVLLAEHGDPAVSLGNVLTIAVTVGVPLFSADTPADLERLRARGRDVVALLPTRVRETTEHRRGVDTDF